MLYIIYILNTSDRSIAMYYILHCCFPTQLKSICHV